MNIFSGRYLIKRRQLDFVRRTFAGKRFHTVVDIGVGTAPYKDLIDHERYIGVDRDDRGGVPDVVIADAGERIPLDDGTADLVISTETLEHVAEPQRAVREMFRILKPGGTLVLTTPMTWQVHEEPHDYYRYTKFGLRHLLEQAGFTDLHIRPSNGYYYSIMQLVVVPLSHWAFKPVVGFLNVLGLVAEKISDSPRMPIDYQAIAFKRGT